MGYQPVMKILQALEKLEHHVLGFAFAQTGILVADYIREQIAASAEFKEYVPATITDELSSEAHEHSH